MTDNWVIYKMVAYVKTREDVRKYLKNKEGLFHFSNETLYGTPYTKEQHTKRRSR